MAFNAEIAAKAADKRLDVIERKLEQLATKSNDNSEFVATKKAHADRLTAIENRLGSVEKLVKVLAESRGDSKLVAIEKVVTVMRDNAAAEAEREKGVLEGLKQVQVKHVDLQRKLTEQIDLQIDKSDKLEQQFEELHKQLQENDRKQRDKARADLDALIAAERAQRLKQEQEAAAFARSLAQQSQQQAEKYVDTQIKNMLSLRIDALEKALGAATNQIAALSKR